MNEPGGSRIQTSITVNRADGSVFQELGSSTQLEIIEGSLEGVEDLAKVKYRPVGRCIYCGGSDGLTKEHIIPFGLNGNAVLPAASCPKCRNITACFERDVLRGSMRAVRVRLKFQSRKKHHGAPLTQRLMFTRNGVSETIDLPIERFPILLRLVKFASPRYFTGLQKSGIDITGVVTILFGPGPEAVGRELGAEELIFTSPRDHPTSFARMIAKIGYGTAFARGDINRIDGPSPVIPSILGEEDDIGRWVGTVPGPLRQYPGLLHRVEIHENADRRSLIAEVQLFSNSPSPSYIVVLGSLKSKAPSQQVTKSCGPRERIYRGIEPPGQPESTVTIPRACARLTLLYYDVQGFHARPLCPTGVGPLFYPCLIPGNLAAGDSLAFVQPGGIATRLQGYWAFGKQGCEPI